MICYVCVVTWVWCASSDLLRQLIVNIPEHYKVCRNAKALCIIVLHGCTMVNNLHYYESHFILQ